MNSRRCGILAVAFAWLTLLPAFAAAQTASAIAGVVKDTSGAVLPGVTVEAASPELIEKVRTVVTDERGKIVRERTKDTFAFWRRRLLNTESNAQFGEGGAGTFSDGKLYSQVKDPRHLGRKVLTEFVKAGAPPEILYVSKPHIGTFRLVTMVEHMRATIEALGGEFRFQTRVDRVVIGKNQKGERRVEALILSDGTTLEADRVVLAVGHSARDTFQMLHDEGVYVEPKPFSIQVVGTTRDLCMVTITAPEAYLVGFMTSRFLTSMWSENLEIAGSMEADYEALISTMMVKSAELTTR